jgi:predicted GNAT family acetyltransferase
MTYSIASPALIIINHTEVGEEFKGKGAGAQLLSALV